MPKLTKRAIEIAAMGFLNSRGLWGEYYFGCGAYGTLKLEWRGCLGWHTEWITIEPWSSELRADARAYQKQHPESSDA